MIPWLLRNLGDRLRFAVHHPGYAAVDEDDIHDVEFVEKIDVIADALLIKGL